MLLHRIGNKSKITNKIIQYFPEHNLYIELFFGAGGLFFNKLKAKYNILNDIDSDIFNLFMILKNDKDNLKKQWLRTPYSESLFKYWKKNKEKDNIMKAIRFLYLSNLGLYGKANTLKFAINNAWKILYENIDKTFEFIQNVQFMNCDFRKVLSKIAIKEMDKGKIFIYADPPYLNTGNNYSNLFIKNDSIDLFDILQNSGIKWAMSEFNNIFILNQAKKRNLNVIEIGERRTLENRQTEILITNYNIKEEQLKLKLKDYYKPDFGCL